MQIVPNNTRGIPPKVGAHDLLAHFLSKDPLGARRGCVMTYAPYSYDVRFCRLRVPIVSTSETRLSSTSSGDCISSDGKRLFLLLAHGTATNEPCGFRMPFWS